MNHHIRAGLLAAAASALATLAYIETQPLETLLAGPHLPTWLTATRPLIIPAIAYLGAWAGHYLLTHNATPPPPPGLQESDAGRQETEAGQ